MKMKNIGTAISRNAGRTGLLVKKHSPEILIGVGIAGVITSTVMACRSALKIETVLDEAKNKIDKIHLGKETLKPEVYNETDYKKDMTIAYAQTGFELFKLYAPSITLGALSIGCILGGYGIMRKRNIALMAAYKTVEQSFTDYRKRVVDELGEEKDREFKYGMKKEKIKVTEVGPDGKEKKSVKEVNVMDPNNISEYAKFFDNSSVRWEDNPEYNMTFLKCQQNYANDMLKANGHLFLNEVYDMLGIPRTRAGAVVGWVLGQGDDFVDFGIFDVTLEGYINDIVNDTIGEQRRDFVNGRRNCILLDFNVDGVIYDLI